LATLHSKKMDHLVLPLSQDLGIKILSCSEAGDGRKAAVKVKNGDIIAKGSDLFSRCRLRKPVFSYRETPRHFLSLNCPQGQGGTSVSSEHRFLVDAGGIMSK
jgi:hypothetical protein